MGEIETLITKANEVRARLKAEFDCMAICHCGDLCKDHGYNSGHSASWNECPESRLISDAEHIIGVLTAAALAAERAKSKTKRCPDCGCELSACGEMTSDGPRMDCPLCLANGTIKELRAKFAAFAGPDGNPRKVAGNGIPVSADGVFLTPGAIVWPHGDVFIDDGEEGGTVMWSLLDNNTGDLVSAEKWDATTCYSTKETATSALAAAKEQHGIGGVA